MSNIERLIDLLRNDPSGEELAEKLAILLESDREEDKILLLTKVAEALRERRYFFSAPERLSDAETAARDLILGERPMTAEELSIRAGQESQLPKTLRHRSGASSVLNALADKGVLGKFALGRDVYFTSPEEAVRRALVMRGEEPQRTNPTALATLTGFSVARIVEVLRDLADETDFGE